MQAVLPVAGMGRRLRPITYKVPKTLVPVAGRPMMEWTMDNLPDEIDKLIMIIGYLGDKIKQRYGKEYKGRKIVYVEQKEQLGTAHALWQCRDFIEDKFIMVYLDDLHARENFERMMEHDLSVLVKKVPDPENYSAIKLDKKGFISEFIEKPKTFVSNLAGIGAYFLDKGVFDYPLKLSERGEYDVCENIRDMAKDRDVAVARAKVWLPMGTPELIKKAEKYIKKHYVVDPQGSLKDR